MCLNEDRNIEDIETEKLLKERIKELEEENESLLDEVDYYNTLYNNLLDDYEKLEKKYIDSKYEIII